MTVKPRGSSFQATVHYKGARFRTDHETERAALIWEAETKAKLLRGERIISPKKGEENADTIWALYEKVCRIHWDRKRGAEAQARNARIFAEWVGVKVAPAKALTQDNVEKFVEHLIKERRSSNSTINKYMSALSMLLRYAKLKGTVELPWYKPGKGRVRFFTQDEETLILQLWAQWGYTTECDFMICLLDLGARPFSELAAAPWRDIDEVARKITFWNTKNNTPRTLPMTTRVLQAIQRQHSNHSDGPFNHLNSPHMQRLWDRTQTHLPQFSDAVIYSARHTCASRLVQRGVDLRRVKEWMGHLTIATTMIYAHLAPDNLMDAVHVLEPDRANVTPMFVTPHATSRV